MAIAVNGGFAKSRLEVFTSCVHLSPQASADRLVSASCGVHKGKYNRRYVLRRFGQVPDEYLGENDGE
jgi:hypothetical protein